MDNKTFRQRLRGLVCIWLSVLLLVPALVTLPVAADEPTADSWDTLKTLAKQPVIDNVYDFEGKTIAITGVIKISETGITLKNANFVCTLANVTSLFKFNTYSSSIAITLDSITIDGGAQLTSPVTHGGPAIFYDTGSGGPLTANIANSKLRNWSNSTNSTNRGGAIRLQSYNSTQKVTLTMTDSTISNCSTIGDGGGVYVGSDSTFNMTGSAITGCTSSDDGGGVYNYGTFNMTESTITDCTAHNNGGGVYEGPLTGDNGKIKLSGTTLISGNTAGSTNAAINNLYLDADPNAVVKIDPTVPLTTGSSIGVTKGTPTAGNPINVTPTNSNDYSTYFYADDGAKYKIQNSGNSNIVQLALGGTTNTQVDFNMQGKATNERRSVTYGGIVDDIPSPSAVGFEFGGWYKEPECTNQWDTNTVVTEPLMVYAKWTPKTYAVTLPSPQIGYTLAAKGGSSSPVAHSGNYTFTLTLDPAYSNSTPVIKVNGSQVTLTNGEYTISNITEAKTITVEGVKATVNSTPASSSDYYTITATASTGGSISPSGFVSVREGLNKAFTITPDEGYAISDVKVDGESVRDKLTNSSYTFENVRKAHTIKAEFVSGSSNDPFTDVNEDDWFFDDVVFVNENNLMDGTGESTFSPYIDTTRAMIVTILYRLEGEPAVTDTIPFDDVEPGSYYEKAITWAETNGIVIGYGNGKFGPNDNIIREQMAAILYRFADYKGYDVNGQADLSKFTDNALISSYAVNAMAWANYEGFINGVDDSILDPTGSANRAQVAAILHRFCDWIKNIK